VAAQHLIVPVAPNWNTNEDLLGFFNPVFKVYVDTQFSHFLRRAAQEYQLATATGRTPRPFHLILDEMNLARVEYYFAKFLSAMELRGDADVEIELAPGELIDLTPNLKFVGTVNVDETTHGFANKVYDRAQLVEVEVPRELIAQHLQGKAYQAVLLEIWDRLYPVAPYAFRVVDEIDEYVRQAATLGTSWQEALDDQLLQKLLPKLAGSEDKVGETLDWLTIRTQVDFPLTHAKVRWMAERCRAHGFTSYF
jgi:5-methylcytosine-specific restriction endonuclease McrBC GTP-binding regulatory subunit McrB